MLYFLRFKYKETSQNMPNYIFSLCYNNPIRKRNIKLRSVRTGGVTMTTFLSVAMIAYVLLQTVMYVCVAASEGPIAKEA